MNMHEYAWFMFDECWQNRHFWHNMSRNQTSGIILPGENQLESQFCWRSICYKAKICGYCWEAEAKESEISREYQFWAMDQRSPQLGHRKSQQAKCHKDKSVGEQENLKVLQGILATLLWERIQHNSDGEQPTEGVKVTRIAFGCTSNSTGDIINYSLGEQPTEEGKHQTSRFCNKPLYSGRTHICRITSVNSAIKSALLRIEK